MSANHSNVTETDLNKVMVSFTPSNELSLWLRSGLSVYLVISTLAGTLLLKIFFNEMFAPGSARGRARAINSFVAMDLAYAVMGVIWNLHVISVILR